MKKERIEEWFEQQQGCWDLADPKEGHQDRFLEKLKKSPEKQTVIPLFTYWKPVAAAAAILLLVTFSLSRKDIGTKELAKVSPKMEEAQDFFTSAIANELYEIDAQRTPATNKLINDAMLKLKGLEQDYEKLKADLAQSGEDKRVIHAMITNFQTRIDLLNAVMQQIEKTKTSKNLNHDTYVL